MRKESGASEDHPARDEKPRLGLLPGRDPSGAVDHQLRISNTGDTYRVYPIKNPQDRRYLGISEDVAKRMEQHHAGEFKWMASRGRCVG